jgi:molybdopterin/thiamine biosynthesis adenylyltransferase
VDSDRSVTRVVIVGAGNIGSHLIPLVARIPGVDRILVIDRDRYEEKNRSGQAIVPRDVGRAKAETQATAIRRIAPHIDAEAHVGEIESFPLGRLRVDLILACLDSLRARQCVNEAAVRLGIPWIDSGVRADGLLARIQAYLPGTDRPCLECAWGEAEYRNLEQEYPCEADRPERPDASRPTNAPAALGALAASLQAIEAEKLLAGSQFVAPGRRIQIDAAHHTHFVTSFHRNPACRLGDHAAWVLAETSCPPSGSSLRELAERTPGSRGIEDCTFAIEVRAFALARTCSACGRRRPALRLAQASSRRDAACRHCGGRMVFTGFDLRDRMGSAELTARQLDSPLDRLGIRPGDIVRVETGATRMRFVISGDWR